MRGLEPQVGTPGLSLRERRTIRARVRWLGHQSGWAEVEVLALARYRARVADRSSLTDEQVGRLQALERLLSAEIDRSVT